MEAGKCSTCVHSGILLETGPERMENDGLNSLRYEMKAFEKLPLYTRILVHINEDIVLVRPRFCLLSDLERKRHFCLYLAS